MLKSIFVCLCALVSLLPQLILASENVFDLQDMPAAGEPVTDEAGLVSEGVFDLQDMPIIYVVDLGGESVFDLQDMPVVASSDDEWSGGQESTSNLLYCACEGPVEKNIDVIKGALDEGYCEEMDSLNR